MSSRVVLRGLVTAFLAGLILSPVVAEEAWPWRDQDEAEVSLLLVGDINIQQRADPAAALVHVRATLNQADLVYGNLEGLLVESLGADRDLPNKSGWQHLGPEAVLGLEAGNITAVGVANNVAYGRDNILTSLSVLDAHGIAHTGAGANLEQAHEPAILVRKGVRFGFLQYTSKWYDEDRQIATSDAPGVARIKSEDGSSIDAGDLARMLEDIRRLRARVDLVVVSTHTRDGQSRGRPAAAPPPADTDLYSLLPVNQSLEQAEPYQKKLARAAIDAGADVVFGHGCHMLQAVEVYRGKPVFYCMGNFASDWIRVRNYRYGLLARVVLRDRLVARVALVPVSRDADSNNVRLLDPNDGEGAELAGKLRELSPGTELPLVGSELVLIP